MVFMANTRPTEGGPLVPKAPEGVSNNGSLLARRVSAVARVIGVRNAHLSKLGTVFFFTNKYGLVRFFPAGGRILLGALFLNRQAR